MVDGVLGPSLLPVLERAGVGYNTALGHAPTHRKYYHYQTSIVYMLFRYALSVSVKFLIV